MKTMAYLSLTGALVYGGFRYGRNKGVEIGEQRAVSVCEQEAAQQWQSYVGSIKEANTKVYEGMMEALEAANQRKFDFRRVIEKQ